MGGADQSDSLPQIMSCNSDRCRKIKATLFLELPQDSLDYLEPAETDKITCYISNETGVNEILKRFFEWQLFFLNCLLLDSNPYQSA
jgi:hypothetical protein